MTTDLRDPAVRVDEALPRRRASAPHARALVAEALTGHAADHHDLSLVVTELVANAVRHGRGRRILLRLESDGRRVVVEVENRCWTTQPHRRLASHSRDSGRGLALVAAMSDRWGVAPGRRGRARVWAELSLDRPRVAGDA